MYHCRGAREGTCAAPTHAAKFAQLSLSLSLSLALSLSLSLTHLLKSDRQTSHASETICKTKVAWGGEAELTFQFGQLDVCVM